MNEETRTSLENIQSLIAQVMLNILDYLSEESHEVAIDAPLRVEVIHLKV